jgi:hypothetical protein
MQVCADCGCDAPEGATSYTLTGMGWRLHRRVDTIGTAVFELRCPNCWQAFKEKRPTLSPPPSSHDTPAEAFARATRRLRRNPPGH